jgi:hypothetical protein
MTLLAIRGCAMHVGVGPGGPKGRKDILVNGAWGPCNMHALAEHDVNTETDSAQQQRLQF